LLRLDESIASVVASVMGDNASAGAEHLAASILDFGSVNPGWPWYGVFPGFHFPSPLITHFTGSDLRRQPSNVYSAYRVCQINIKLMTRSP
jgi:hypothetical protein